MSIANVSLRTHVHFQDGVQGDLYRMVVQPATSQITALVVRRGMLRKHMWVLPISLVNFVNADGVFVAIHSAQLDSYPAYREYDREIPVLETNWELESPSLRMTIWLPHYGLFEDVKHYISMVPRHICEGIATDQRALGCDTHIHCISGEVGKLDHLVVDTETWQIIDLIVHRWLRSNDLVIPQSWIASIDESVNLSVTASRLQQLHYYRPRPDDEILLKLRQWFDEAPYDYHDVLPLVEDGILHLHGVVENEAAKQHAEVIGRSIPGIFLVENRLETSTAITSQVTAVLRGDDQSEPAPPLSQV